jgi:ABC-type antimicrobial peptide transport system permease subunit
VVTAWIGAQTLESLVYDVAPRDPTVLATATAAIALIAVVAAYIPARRAARVDPLIALRQL